nr:MAG TPA: hypothetical protein [Caudoviricetes sp.]
MKLPLPRLRAWMGSTRKRLTSCAIWRIIEKKTAGRKTPTRTQRRRKRYVNVLPVCWATCSSRPSHERTVRLARPCRAF